VSVGRLLGDVGAVGKMELSKIIAGVAAGVAAVSGAYTLIDKFGFLDHQIIEWSPEHFKIVAHKGEPITVTVARIKKRDDCSVEGFTPAIRDSTGMVYEAVPSATKFSGPASHEIDTFTYQLTVPEKVKTGMATLIATIKYKCPEGERIVQYPKHENLQFKIE
jgi:hypothetical protein